MKVHIDGLFILKQYSGRMDFGVDFNFDFNLMCDDGMEEIIKVFLNYLLDCLK